MRDFGSKLGSWFKNQLIYYTGREVLGFAVLPMLFSVLWGASPSMQLGIVFTIALAATIPLQIFIGYRKQASVENRMLNDYRNEIAAQVGLPERQVTREHLHQVADGDPEKGIMPNEVIQQARDRENTRQHVRQLLITVSAVAAFGLFLVLHDMPQVQNVIGWIKAGAERISEIVKWPFHFEKPILTAMLFSGMGTGLVHTVLDYAIEGLFQLNRKTAHELIMDIKQDMVQNRAVSREKVFGVFVAIHPGLDATLEAVYQKPYYKLDPAQQTEALQVYGREFQNPLRVKRTIDKLVDDINHKRIEADELAFAVFGRYSGVPKQRGGNLQTSLNNFIPVPVIVPAIESLQQVEQAASQPSENRPVVKWAQEREESYANDNVPGFAERFQPKNNQPAESFADREKQRGLKREEQSGREPSTIER